MKRPARQRMGSARYLSPRDALDIVNAIIIFFIQPLQKRINLEDYSCSDWFVISELFALKLNYKDIHEKI